MNKLFTSIFVLSIVLTLTCSGVVADERKLTFSAGSGAMAGALDVAETKGFFIEKGIKGKVNSYRKGSIALENYLIGKDNVATCGSINIVLANFDLSQHRIIGTLAYTDNQLKILGRKSSGINKATDLRGKKIGTVPGGMSNFYLYKFLVLNGISIDEVSIVYMNKKKLPKAIANGDIDVICQKGKPIENAKKMIAEDWIIFPDTSIHRKTTHIIIPVDILNKKPDQVKGVLRATLKAEEFIKTDTDESIDIVAKAKKYPYDLMSESMRNEMEYYLSIKQSLLLELESMEQWAIDNNLVARDTPRNYLNFIDYGPLQEVAPERVTIIQ